MIVAGEDPLKVPLWLLNIWIQIHDLPMGFMMESVGKQLWISLVCSWSMI